MKEPTEGTEPQEASNSNVVPLKPPASRSDAHYAPLLRTEREKLTALEGELFDAAVNLAMAGPWKQWNQEQGVGAQVNIDLKALLDTSDPKVTALATLLLDVHQCLEELNGQ